MKNILFAVLFILWVMGVTYGIYARTPSIDNFLEELINDNAWYVISEEICEQWAQINTVFNSLTKLWYFDKNHLWSGKYFNILVELSDRINDQNNNLKTNSVFPYVNDKFLYNWKWINTICSWSKSVYVAWWFYVEWIVEKNSSSKVYLKNPQIDAWAWEPIYYSKIYVKPNNLNIVKNFPYVDDWKIFVWCIQDGNYSHLLHYIKSDLKWNNVTYTKKNVYFWTNKVVSWKVEWLEYENLDFWKYKNWDNIKIKFYVDPWFISRAATIECENPWMLSYEILQHS